MESIINYKKKYLNQVVDLFIDVFSQEPWNDSWDSNKHAEEFLQDIVNTPGFKSLLYLKDDKVIGALFGHIIKWYEGDELYIREFFIDSNFQGKGIGTKLMNKLEKELKIEDIHTIVLLTERDTEAKKFYDNKGFEVNNDIVFMIKNYE